MKGKVYFFHNGKACKIGMQCPEDIRTKLWAAHVWSPHALNIVGWINTDFPDQLEKQIHLQMAHRWINKGTGHGEWFDLSLDETTKVIESNKHGNIIRYNYSNAPGHPAHHVRPLWRGQQDQAPRLGKDVSRRAWSVWNPGPKRVQSVVGGEHAIGCQAFLRQAGT
jgi:hypothetical protein